MIPHFIALFFVGIGAFFVAIYGFFAVLFTGRWPRGAFEYLVGTFRWAYRVVAYFHLMTDAYPPFSLADDPNYPVRLNIDYPEHVAQLAAARAVAAGDPVPVIAGVLYWLTGVLTIVAFFTILFTKQIPRGRVRAHGARPAVEPSRQRVRVFHDRALPAVHLGVEGAVRSGCRTPLDAG